MVQCVPEGIQGFLKKNFTTLKFFHLCSTQNKSFLILLDERVAQTVFIWWPEKPQLLSVAEHCQ